MNNTSTPPPRIAAYCGTSGNNHVVTINGVDIYFSYQTPVAFCTPTSGGPVVRQNDWNKTTGKHLKTIDGGSKSALAARLPGDRFEDLLRRTLGQDRDRLVHVAIELRDAKQTLQTVLELAQERDPSVEDIIETIESYFQVNP